MASSQKQVVRFFQSSNPSVLIKCPKNPEKVMQWVLDADYLNLKDSWESAPEMMMEPVLIRTPDGVKSMSPLQKAFELYDTYTWMEFYETIRRNQDLQERYIEQLSQQQTFLSLDKLFQAYDQLFERLEKDDPNPYFMLGRTGEIGMYLNALANAQKTELPMHMIREFFRQDEKNWQEASEFDVKSFSPPVEEKSQKIIRRDLGDRNILARNKGDIGLLEFGSVLRDFKDFPPVFASVLKQDSAVFKRLFDKRKEQFDDQIGPAPGINFG